MGELFGKRKSKVSKDDVNASILKANTRLTEANKRIDIDIKDKKKLLKSLNTEYKECKKSLKEAKDMLVYSEKELQSQQYEIHKIEEASKKNMDSLIELSGQEELLKESVISLKEEESLLSQSVSALKEKQLRLSDINNDLSTISKKKQNTEKSLKSGSKQLDKLKSDIEMYTSRKSVAEREFNTFKGEIEREKRIAEERLKEVTDLTLRIDTQNKEQLSAIDTNIATRMSEVKDIEDIMMNKHYEHAQLQSKLQSLESDIEDAENAISYSINKEKEKVTEIKQEFKKWKIEALESVARLQLKGKLETIDKAGLGDILNG